MLTCYSMHLSVLVIPEKTQICQYFPFLDFLKKKAINLNYGEVPKAKSIV